MLDFFIIFCGVFFSFLLLMAFLEAVKWQIVNIVLALMRVKG